MKSITVDELLAENKRLCAYILGTMPDSFGFHDIHEIAAGFAAKHAGSDDVEPDDDDYIRAALLAYDLSCNDEDEGGSDG